MGRWHGGMVARWHGGTAARRLLVLVGLLIGFPRLGLAGERGCPAAYPRALFGLLGRPLTLAELVQELEKGCLALNDVRFRPGQDTIEVLSPAQLADVARALGMAQGAYRVTVAPEGAPGWPADTVQARRRATKLRDELVHYGASTVRLLEGSVRPLPAVAPGSAVPMLVRVKR